MGGGEGGREGEGRWEGRGELSPQRLSILLLFFQAKINVVFYQNELVKFLVGYL